MILKTFGYSLCRSRRKFGVRQVTRMYITLVRRPFRWWFQTTSLLSVGFILIYLTMLLASAFVQNRVVRELGVVHETVLQQVMSEAGVPNAVQSLHLVLAQKSLLEHIRLTKEAELRFSLVSRLGINLDKTQVCPFAGTLLRSIRESFMVPVRNQLEYELRTGKSKLSAGELSQLYFALQGRSTEEGCRRLAHFWYNALEPQNQSTVREEITEEDLFVLLAYYFRYQSEKNMVPLDMGLVSEFRGRV